MKQAHYRFFSLNVDTLNFATLIVFDPRPAYIFKKDIFNKNLKLYTF